MLTEDPVQGPMDAPGPDGDADEPATLDADDVFHLLQNQRRRYALQYLRQVDADSVRMRDLAEQVAAWEHDTTVELLSSKERQRVYIPLYQNHLPKLDEEGVIDYQQSRGVVTRRAAADQLDPYLPGVEDESDEAAEGTPWHRYYLGTAFGGLGLLAAVWTGAPGFAAVPDAVAGGAVVATVAVVALVQALVGRST